MRVTGVLRHEDLEGGVWLLVGDDGKRWQLEGAPAGFSSGERVVVEGDRDTASLSFQMAGPLLRVRSIRRG